ncbi:unnamed protein product, partial [Chrysoparadoxa australica]
MRGMYRHGHDVKPYKHQEDFEGRRLGERQLGDGRGSNSGDTHCNGYGGYGLHEARPDRRRSDQAYKHQEDLDTAGIDSERDNRSDGRGSNSGDTHCNGYGRYGLYEARPDGRRSDKAYRHQEDLDAAGIDSERDNRRDGRGSNSGDTHCNGYGGYGLYEARPDRRRRDKAYKHQEDLDAAGIDPERDNRCDGRGSNSGGTHCNGYGLSEASPDRRRRDMAYKHQEDLQGRRYGTGIDSERENRRGGRGSNSGGTHCNGYGGYGLYEASPDWRRHDEAYKDQDLQGRRSLAGIDSERDNRRHGRGRNSGDMPFLACGLSEASPDRQRHDEAYIGWRGLDSDARKSYDGHGSQEKRYLRRDEGRGHPREKERNVDVRSKSWRQGERHHSRRDGTGNDVWHDQRSKSGLREGWERPSTRQREDGYGLPQAGLSRGSDGWCSRHQRWDKGFSRQAEMRHESGRNWEKESALAENGLRLKDTWDKSFMRQDEDRHRSRKEMKQDGKRHASRETWSDKTDTRQVEDKDGSVRRREKEGRRERLPRDRQDRHEGDRHHSRRDITAEVDGGCSGHLPSPTRARRKGKRSHASEDSHGHSHHTKKQHRGLPETQDAREQPQSDEREQSQPDKRELTPLQVTVLGAFASAMLFNLEVEGADISDSWLWGSMGEMLKQMCPAHQKVIQERGGPLEAAQLLTQHGLVRLSERSDGTYVAGMKLGPLKRWRSYLHGSNLSPDSHDPLSLIHQLHDEFNVQALLKLIRVVKGMHRELDKCFKVEYSDSASMMPLNDVVGRLYNRLVLQRPSHVPPAYALYTQTAILALGQEVVRALLESDGRRCKPMSSLNGKGEPLLYKTLALCKLPCWELTISTSTAALREVIDELHRLESEIMADNDSVYLRNTRERIRVQSGGVIGDGSSHKAKGSDGVEERVRGDEERRKESSHGLSCTEQEALRAGKKCSKPLPPSHRGTKRSCVKTPTHAVHSVKAVTFCQFMDEEGTILEGDQPEWMEEHHFYYSRCKLKDKKGNPKKKQSKEESCKRCKTSRSQICKECKVCTACLLEAREKGDPTWCAPVMDKAIFDAAKKSGGLQKCIKLIEGGANPNFQRVTSHGETALLTAVLKCDERAVERLLQLGADPTLPDHRTTPAELARELCGGTEDLTACLRFDRIAACLDAAALRRAATAADNSSSSTATNT